VEATLTVDPDILTEVPLSLAATILPPDIPTEEVAIPTEDHTTIEDKAVPIVMGLPAILIRILENLICQFPYPQLLPHLMSDFLLPMTPISLKRKHKNGEKHTG